MNKNRNKFLVEVTIQNVQLLVHFQCKIQVVIKKGSQKIETQSNYELLNGIATINETLQFNITTDLTQDGKLDDKKAQLVVILVTEKGQKSAGFHNLDFSQYLDQQNIEFQETLELDKCPDKKAKLMANFRITKIGEQDNDVGTEDQSFTSQQASLITPGNESQNHIISQKGVDQIFQTESKLDVIEITQQKSENESQIILNNKDIKINEQNQLIQQLHNKIEDMIQKDIYQDMTKKYEQQLKEQEDKIKLLQDDNAYLNLQLQAKQSTIEKQNEDLSKLNRRQGNSKETSTQQYEELIEQIKLLKSDLQQQSTEKDQLNQLNESMVLQIQSYSEKLEIQEKQIKDKNEQIQNMKNLTSGTISALQKRNEILEKYFSEQKGLTETQNKLDQQPIKSTSDESENLIEELQLALNLKSQDLENLKQKSQSELTQKDQIIQNLQSKLDEVLNQEIHISRLDHESKTQIIQSEKQINETNVKSKQEQQMNRLKTQIQIWQSKYESNQKILSDYTNEAQYLLRQINNVPNFLADQKELVEPLLLLRRAIQEKFQNYQKTQQISEQRMKDLEQELEVCQYKLKLEQSQQCSDSQSQPQIPDQSMEVSKINECLEQNKEELRTLQQQLDQQKLLYVDAQKQLEETKTQIASMRTTLAKCKQQLAESMQEKVLLQAKLSELQKAIKEKNQEIQKQQEIIAELEQYNIQMDEALSQTLDQYKLQNTQMKQAYEKEKKLKQELLLQIKNLKEDQTKILQNDISKNKGIEEKQQQCNCKEKIQFYEQKIAELEFQMTDLQIQKLDKTIQRNSIAQIRTSILVSHRESLAFQQLEDANNQRNETVKPKEVEDQNINLTDERFKLSKEYQTILERALLANSQIENKYKNIVKDLEDTVDVQAKSLVKMKLEIADLYSAAIDIGGAMLVDKLHIALGVIE